MPHTTIEVYIGFESDPIYVDYLPEESLGDIKQRALIQVMQDVNQTWIVKNDQGEVLNEYLHMGVMTPIIYVEQVPLIE